MLKVRNGLTKQYNMGSWIGGLKDLIMRVLLYVAIINFVLIVATAYHTTLRETLQVWIPWLTFPMFLGSLVVLLLLVMVLEYKIVLPSTWSFVNRQQYEHKSPIKEQLDRIEKMLADIQKGEVQEKE